MAIFNSYVSLPEGTSGAYLSNLVLFRVWSPGGKSQNIRTFFSINHGSVGWSTSMWNLKNLNDFNKTSTCIYTFLKWHLITMKSSWKAALTSFSRPKRSPKRPTFRLERNDSASRRWSHWRPTQSYAPTMMRRLQAAEEVSGDIMRI